MEKVFIKNRKDQNISVIFEAPQNPVGLAFIMHGLGGFKKQDHIQTFAQSFQEKGYATVLFDTTNSFGESEGNYEDATVTNYYEDLEDVITWAKTYEWYQEPFVLAGHSLGGICTALYAENHPKDVKGLAPISTVVSGKLSLTSPNKKDMIEEWKKTGWKIKESQSIAGLIKRLKWSYMEDRLQYDLLKNTQALTMPVLMIVGSEDTSTPVEQQQLLFEKIPQPAELHIIKEAPHTFREQKHLEEIKQIFSQWIDSLV